MVERPRLQPRSRKAWRAWLAKHHASSTGVWLVYAKKHTGIPSLSYNDAVEEALCFGWIDSKVNPIDENYYMQVFTPRKPKSVWSALNKARVARMQEAGLMTATGLAAIGAAKASGAWHALTHIDDLTMPPDLEKAIRANPEAARHWPSYSPSRRKAVLYRLAGAKRPDTREKYLSEIIEHMARNLSSAERRALAGFRPKLGAARRKT